MTQNALGKKKGIADIVFLIDSTGSMEPCLDALKKNIGILIDYMVDPGPNADALVSDWRIKVCGYRDANNDPASWWDEKQFTADIDQVKSDLNSLEAKGGGDEPESLLDGLWKLAKMKAANAGEVADGDSWRHHHDAARCVIVFTDASCHMVTASPDASGATFDDVNREVCNARLRLSLYCPEADCYHTISQIDKSEVEFIGPLSNAQEGMAEFSRDTGKFKKTLEQLAKTITASANTPVL